MPLSLSTYLQNGNPGSLPFLLRDTDLRGGFKIFADTTARDASLTGSRTRGMFVYCVAEDTFYTLATADITNTGWSVLNLSKAISLGSGLKLDGSGNLAVDETTMPALAISDVTGLQTALDGKASTSHTHVKADITDFSDGDYATAAQGALADSALQSLGSISGHTDVTITTIADGEILKFDTGVWVNNTLAEAGISEVGHSHVIADVTGLQTALDGKASTSHTHAISDVTGLQSALDGKAALSHTHIIDDVTGLQTALDGKSNVGHSHTVENLSDTTISSVTNGEILKFDTGVWVNNTLAEAGISAVGHTHAISDVTGLQTALDGKAATTHTHAISDVTGLQSALDGKAALSHTHSGADITSGTVAATYLPQMSTLNGVTISSAAPTGGSDGDVWFQIP